MTFEHSWSKTQEFQKELTKINKTKLRKAEYLTIPIAHREREKEGERERTFKIWQNLVFNTS